MYTSQKVDPMRSHNSSKKSTFEIKVLIENANMKFESVVNEALNNYLPTIFASCPFTHEVCIKSQCMECDVAKSRQTHFPEVVV